MSWQDLPARFSYSSSFLSLTSAESRVEPDDPCCPTGCSWVRSYEDRTSCYGAGCEVIPRADYLFCTDQRGSCQAYQIKYQTCTVQETGFEHRCPYADLSPCGTDPTPTPTPSPSPATSPTPTPTPTPTPCTGASFDPNSDGSCPIYSNKINGYCVCQVRNTDCERFGQGTLNGVAYCSWQEHLCDCYNLEGKCSENPRPMPSPTSTVSSQPGGGGGGGGGGAGGTTKQYEQCTEYWWVYYESYNGGSTWHEVSRSYAGCW